MVESPDAAFPVALLVVGVVVGLAALVLLVPPLRRVVVTRPVLAVLARLELLPRLSDTEREALEAGTVWVDRELFSGSPDWRRILAEPYPELTETEQALLDGAVEEVCAAHDEWETQRRQDLSPETWELLRSRRLLALVIPKEHGGLGLGAWGHGAVVTKLATRSLPLAVTVMVPNSLGPAELLVHHGTPEQRERWLPGLASGEEIPCFALTEPEAGSDAAAMTSRGVVERGPDGELQLRLTWRKRYITLAPKATVLGLAFKLEDPDELLGMGPAPGITCALVPADTPGVVADERHDPLGVPFMNGPTEGRDVVVPVDAILGGPSMAGRGWQVLMETLAAGRGISLPSMSVGLAKQSARVAGAHAAVREQFGLPIWRFEGVSEVLARLAGRAFIMEATQRFTCGAVDAGEKPAVVSAIAKLRLTEMARDSVADAMDVTAGNGIVRGPRNLLAGAHAAVPIGITVEGANILTRTLIVFGQGAIRCHPHALDEIQAAAEGDVEAFDRAFFAHVVHVVKNAGRTLFHGATRGRFVRVPRLGGAEALMRRVSWASAWLALHSDLAMGLLGGRLKRCEMLTGRFADLLSALYLATAAIRRFEAETASWAPGSRARSQPAAMLQWSVEHLLAEAQAARVGILENFPVPVVGGLLRHVAAPFARWNPFSRPPSDELSRRLAVHLVSPGSFRDALLAGSFVPSDPAEPLARLEEALRLTEASFEAVASIRNAMKDGQIPRARPEDVLEEAVAAGVVDRDDADLVARAAAARRDVIEVDSFPTASFADAVPTAPGS